MVPRAGVRPAGTVYLPLRRDHDVASRRGDCRRLRSGPERRRRRVRSLQRVHVVGREVPSSEYGGALRAGGCFRWGDQPLEWCLPGGCRRIFSLASRVVG
ncbi:hypothetical protein TNCT_354301 [Trichonephila clavata]|uniref:Uncharacterized protein n=1 Tax=Trichonephila clavata TaxID=2740835 RepID=A0A8X6H866_TRICU|nr:hypothetical protein TNCT_354301 [Trichonephila clavata]